MSFKSQKYSSPLWFFTLFFISLSLDVNAECLSNTTTRLVLSNLPANSFVVTTLCASKPDYYRVAKGFKLINFHTIYRIHDSNVEVVDTHHTVHLRVQGTRAQPDPVETKIRELTQIGQLRVLRVLESFPLQFDIEGSVDAIEQVQALVQK